MTIEQAFFSWVSWDEVDTMAFSFYDVVLNVPIGDHKKGEKFASVTMNYDSGYIQLFRDPEDEEPEEYHLVISIGNRVTKKKEKKA